MITKTINPIHFEDLEPHRFEDLIRQLIYNFKEWSSLEATGKLGSDDGVDIRGFEKISKKNEYSDEDEEEQEENYNERLWFIQCKREKTITPAKIQKIISESFISGVPEAYILAAACDFSKKTRDVFRNEMQKYKIKEFYLWGKAELEDMLYQEKNDSILFTFFGYSIHLKQKNISNILKKRTSIKRKLKKIDYSNGVVVKEYNNDLYKSFNNDFYYFKYPFEFYDIGIYVSCGCYNGFIDIQNKSFDFDIKSKFYKPILFRDQIKITNEISEQYEILEGNKCIIEELTLLKYDDILEIDEIGDFYSENIPIITIKNKKDFLSYKVILIKKNDDILDYCKIRNNNVIKEFKKYKRIEYFK